MTLSMVCGSAGASPSQAIFNKAKALLKRGKEPNQKNQEQTLNAFHFGS